MNEKEKKEKKLNLKEMWKDPKGKAKIELCLYGIFFIGVVIFVRVMGSSTPVETTDNNSISNSFLNTIEDNYEYTIEIKMDDETYKYYGKKLGYNSSITREDTEEKEFYYLKEDKYYVLDGNGNYLLTNEDDVFPYVDYRFLNINNIKEYIKLGNRKDNYFEIKLTDLVLNYNGEGIITISIDEEEKQVIIDYTDLFKIDNENIEEVNVKINFYNIDKITTLEEWWQKKCKIL